MGILCLAYVLKKTTNLRIFDHEYTNITRSLCGHHLYFSRSERIDRFPAYKRQQSIAPGEIVEVGAVKNPVLFVKVLRCAVIHNKFGNNPQIIHPQQP